MKVGYQHKVSQVKFSVVVEEGSVDVHLDYECFGTWFQIFLLIYFVLWVIVSNSMATLTAFPFQNISELVNLINDSNTVSSVGVFSRFDDPYISSFAMAMLFLFFFDLFFALLIKFHKSLVLDILCTIFDVEG